VDSLPIPPHPALAAPTTGSYLRRNLAGLLAVLMGLAGLALAVLPQRLIDPPEHNVGTEIRNLVRGIATGEVAPDVAAYQETMKRLDLAAMVSGFIGVALLVLARVRREDKPLLWAAAGVIAFGLFWKWIIVGIVLAVILVILVGS
jgi:hypothetical protein